MTLYEGLEALPGWVAERHPEELRARLARSLVAHAEEGGLDPVVLAVRTTTRTGDVLSIRVESDTADGVRLATSTSSFDLHDPVHGPRGTWTSRMVLVTRGEGFPPLGSLARGIPVARSGALLALAAARSRVAAPTLTTLLDAVRASPVTDPASDRGYELTAVLEADHPEVSRYVVELATVLLAEVASGVPPEWALRRVVTS